jgi:hypothetical protein
MSTDRESFLAACATDLKEFTDGDCAAWRQIILSPMGHKILGFLQLELMRYGGAALNIKVVDEQKALRDLARIQGEASAFSRTIDILLNLAEPGHGRADTNTSDD